MSLGSEEWRCSHGHTRQEHPVCYQSAKDQEKNKTLDTWVSCGKAQITSSGKMLRVTVDEEEHYFFFPTRARVHINIEVDYLVRSEQK